LQVRRAVIGGDFAEVLAAAQAWKEFTLTIHAASSHTRISFINGNPFTDDSNGLDAVHLN
jgi:hypothetical protein